MKNSLTSLVLGGAIFVFTGLVSCSSEDPSNPNDDAKEATLSIFIPQLVNTTPESETRATFDVDQTSEAAISDLWVYGFAVEGSSGKNFSSNIKGSHSYVGTSTYETFDIPLVTIGKYRIYLLANLSSYLDGATKSAYDAGSLSEDQIKGLVMKFSSTSMLTSGNLPMACDNEHVKTSETTTVTGGEFDFGQYSTLYADMELLCSKVRYTILFDNTSADFSQAFGNVLVDFNVESGNTKATNVVSQVAYKTGTASSTPFEYTGLSLAKVAYPTETVGKLYLDIAKNEANLGDKVTLPNLGSPSTTWDSDGKRAWQGVAYLPENPNGTTTINFTPASTAVDETRTHLDLYWNSKGLVRGNFYEIVAVIKDPKTMEVSVKVKVNDWKYEAHTTTW